MFEKYRCLACYSDSCELFLRREGVPVQQNFLSLSHSRAVNVPRGDLCMCFCNECGFVFNAAFDQNLMVYDSDYNNTQESSEHFKAHLQTIKDKLVLENDLRNSTIAEIGCGKGFFLKMMVLDEGLNNRGFGFDPAYVGEEKLADGRLVFQKKYFDSSCAGFKADALLCRHVIEHVSNPVSFLSEIRNALAESRDCRLFFETPCVEWIFDNMVIWDFFYEHCSLFSPGSISRLFARAGFTLKKVEHVFSGQYLWLEAANSGVTNTEVISDRHISEKMQKFAAYEKSVLANWRALIHRVRKSGKLAVWGAGAKGVTFVNLLDRDCQLIDFVIDMNPDKHKRFVPGTGHRVTGYNELFDNDVKNVIVMNPNYIEEIRALLGNHAADLNLIIEPGEYNDNSDRYRASVTQG
ncbi:MAG: methyltransferase domain-containing protein [Erysipelotrichia bacterium]|nr:methyltransferase domain-containing protein [Erysipelotrichia bacterium]